MGERLTDRAAVRVALLLARDYEDSYIEAYRNSITGNIDESEPGVKLARQRIVAFERVLNRYFGGAPKENLPTGKLRPLTELLAAKETRQFDPEHKD